MSDLWQIIKWSVIAIVLIGALVVVGYEVDIHMISPVARQDQLNSPNRTINLRQDFHNKLTEVLTADSNIVALAQRIKNNEKTVSGYTQSQTYQDDQQQLSGLITIRTSAISGYNEQAQGTDTAAWNDICMPHSIDNTTLDSSDLTGMIAQLTTEKITLTAKDGKC